MAANSLPRRLLKAALSPLLGDSTYRYFQALAMAWDIRSGNWMEPELALLPYVVSEGDSAIDVGANAGLYAFHLSRAVGKSGKVFSFEPIPFTYSTLALVKRLLRLRNVQAFPVGCGERRELARFSIPMQRSGARATGQAHMALRKNDRPGREQHVPGTATSEVECEIVPLDEMLPTVTNLSLMKLDIEGAELFALRGARRLLVEHKPMLICEINPWFLEGFGIALSALTGFFDELGYRSYRVRPEQKGLRLREVSLKGSVDEGNYVFLHPERTFRASTLIDELDG